MPDKSDITKAEMIAWCDLCLECHLPNLPLLNAKIGITGLDAIKAIRNALSAMPEAPEGWVCVPQEPTVEMECAVRDPDDCATPDAANRVYRDMLAAAPKPPQQSAETEQRIRKIVEAYFMPWGAVKFAMCEDIISDGKFSAEAFLMAIKRVLYENPEVRND